MLSTAVNHCKHHALDAVTPFLYGLTDAPSPYMVHEWVGLVFIYRTSIRSRSGPAQVHRETRRTVFACGDGEAGCTGAVPSVSLAAVGRPGATAVLHPERGQPLTKSWSR